MQYELLYRLLQAKWLFVNMEWIYVLDITTPIKNRMDQ